jgi:hypothetical protein
MCSSRSWTSFSIDLKLREARDKMEKTRELPTLNVRRQAIFYTVA